MSTLSFAQYLPLNATVIDSEHILTRTQVYKGHLYDSSALFISFAGLISPEMDRALAIYLSNMGTLDEVNQLRGAVRLVVDMTRVVDFGNVDYVRRAIDACVRMVGGAVVFRPVELASKIDAPMVQALTTTMRSEWRKGEPRFGIVDATNRELIDDLDSRGTRLNDYLDARYPLTYPTYPIIP